MRNKSFCSSMRVPACAPTEIKVADKTTLIKPRMYSTSKERLYWVARSGRTLYLFVAVIHLNTCRARLHADVLERGGVTGQRDVVVVPHVVDIEHHAPVLWCHDREADATGGNAVALQHGGREVNSARCVSGSLLRGVARGGRQISRPAASAEREFVLGERARGIGRRIVDARARRG